MNVQYRLGVPELVRSVVKNNGKINANSRHHITGTVVVDNGCGFLATLRGHRALHQETHLAAILAALQPRVSCNRDLGLSSDSVNQGVGLTTTNRIAERAGGRLYIASGDAIYSAGGYSWLSGMQWQGVAIALECKRQRLPDVHFRDLLPPLDAQPAVQLRFQ